MTYRVAIIGCGMIAGRFEDFYVPATYSHAKAFLRHGAFGELAFCDSQIDRAEFLAVKTGGMAFACVEEVLTSFRPDVVSVCVPDNLHFQFIESIMQSPYTPRLIFAEKPVCTSRNELALLCQMQNAGGARIIVNHSRRFDEAHRRLQALIARADLGPPVHIHVDYYGGWRHLGVHVVDTLQYFFGVSLELNRLEYCCESKYADDPTLNVTGEIDSAIVTLDGHKEEYYQILDMNIMCERGQIKLTDFGKRIEVLRKTVNTEHENVLETDLELSGAGMQSPICNAVYLIADYLKNGDHSMLVPYGLDEASRTMNVIWKGSDIYAAQS